MPEEHGDERARSESEPLSAAEQVEMESELARQLLDADDETRQDLYASVYDRIYTASLARVGDSPEEQTFGATTELVPLLEDLTKPGNEVLEVGCGCGLLSLELARLGRKVRGVDVSKVAIDVAQAHAKELGPAAPSFDVTGGDTLPFADESFDFVFSVEVLEHLHERDVPGHLAELFRVLRPGGRVWILTPHAFTAQDSCERWGVHDHAQSGAADVHLKVWAYSDLGKVMRSVGFSRLRSPWGTARRRHVHVPVSWKALAERLADRAPARMTNRLLLAAGAYATSVLATRPGSGVGHLPRLIERAEKRT